MQNAQTTAQPRRKKITAQILKFSDYPVGHKFQGVLVAMGQERPWVDKTTGEQKNIPLFTFEDKETKERTTVFGDSGLVNAMTSAGCTPGDWLEIEKLEQVDLGGGKRVNQYDIYQLA